MRLSRYVHFAENPNGNGAYLFSGISKGLAMLEPETVRLLQSGDFDELREDIIQELVEGRVLIPDSTDERGHLLMSVLRQMVGSGEHLSLTLLPTTTCNFACPYCFEENKEVAFMSRLVQDAVVKMVQRLRPRRLYVSWFGGEPTLAIKQIARLSRQLMQLCENNDAKYIASMVTNGYLLDTSLSQHLKELGVTNVQITLDGPKEVHDARRFLKGGGPTFDRIMSNIRPSRKHLSVNIRVNVDPANEAEVPDLLATLHEQGLYPGGVTVSFGHVRSGINTKSPCDSYFSRAEYADFVLRLVANEEIPLSIRREVLQDLYPKPNNGTCSANYMHAFVIEPAGEVKTCWEHVGVANQSCGNITKDSTDTIRMSRKFLEPKIKTLRMTLSQCWECDLLPVCMGGCIERRDTADPNCPAIHQGMSEWLTLFAQHLAVAHMQTEAT